MTDEASKDLLASVSRAANDLNEVQLTQACAELSAAFRKNVAAFKETDALGAFKSLRRKRMFKYLEGAVAVYLEQRQSGIVQTLLAQALIDQGRLVAGLDAANKALQISNPESKAAEEARGLLGRAYKQAFVQPSGALPAGAEALKLAVSGYQHAYKHATRDRLWPGVNLLALLLRAQKDEMDPGIILDAQQLAAELLSHYEEQESDEEARAARAEEAPRDQPWLLASGMEIKLALGADDSTVRLALRYLACTDADAFEFGGTARQLREIWQLEQHANPKVAGLSMLLEATVLQRGGGFVSDPSRAPQSIKGDLQAVYGLERFQSMRWLERGIKAANGVARIEDQDGVPIGTGFLVRGRNLNSAWGDRQMLVTNHHVIGDPKPQNGVTPRNAVVRFTVHTGEDAIPGIPVDQIEWSSEPLDVAIVSLKRRVTLDYVLDTDNTSALEVTAPPGRIFVIGHPGGEPLFYSMYDNEIVAYDSPFLYYRSPTLNGSSGSPLLNREWAVIGVHHHGNDPTHQANGGTLVRAIRS